MIHAVELQGISASYGKQRVLGPLSLQVKYGEAVAFVGKSGGGKSTLLSTIYDRLRGRATLVPQDLGLVHNLSVYHNVYMGRLDRHPNWYNLINLARPHARQVADIQPLLDRLAIGDKRRTPVGELSGGQRQRVAVARALYQGGDILLADEPVSALDGPKADQVMACLSAAFPTALVALHDVDLALRYCQRIIGIRDGQIALDQPRERLSAQTLLEFY